MDEIDWYAVVVPEKEGEISKVQMGGKSICLIRRGNWVYATSSHCPHAGADLSQGWCEDGKLVCPFHRHKFDLQTGKGNAGQGNYIDVFSVKEENGVWYVGIKKSWWKRLFS